ncbi:MULTISPECIES: helix-turn-helix domain-containing protein [Pseudanabaena]|uniref:Helix-turn-helix domain protein n=2 Tax=Pseudanabaena TaxID=1152 RepID=L8N1A3_9CYAN|nr:MULTISPECIES: helix-turn-helix transcriptional regulator [Pseudanabaena]ELS32038.1 helix-turn-helix domain protein [Pseudanabaena biceps PCC 7429]MDG3495723.1 helix-turn-helix transcriptional regulator [Pseudanabaena catenata USMAC16]
MDDDAKLALKLLAEQIKKRRKILGLSQEKLAEKCGFDRTYISLLERSARNPSYLNLKKLSNGLGISLSELLSEL